MKRRTVLRGLGVLGVAAWAGLRPGRTARAAPACVLTPQQTAGPFYFDPALLRRDITEARPGAALTLRLQVVDAGSCAPIANAVVDVWHTDAGGLYSGYANQGENRVDTRGQTFMRGLQVTDGDGVAEFATVYPGWYAGRTTHIHFKVHVDDQTYVTSQLYFPESVTAEVYATGVYAARGQNPTSNAGDGVLQDGQLEQLALDVGAEGDGYLGVLALGIDLPQAATPTGAAPTETTTPTATAVPEVCDGDCSGDGRVTVAELIEGVNQALGSGGTCTAFDRDGNQNVSIGELIAAVTRALSGC
ncbi:MAG: intradiol ring-cleavage dioxygenase [Candidatus Binatia bacterium]